MKTLKIKFYVYRLYRTYTQTMCFRLNEQKKKKTIWFDTLSAQNPIKNLNLRDLHWLDAHWKSVACAEICTQVEHASPAPFSSYIYVIQLASKQANSSREIVAGSFVKYSWVVNTVPVMHSNFWHCLTFRRR